jgi:hypothetical protein
MTNLRPPDGKIFVDVLSKEKGNVTAIVTRIGNLVEEEIQVGKKISLSKAPELVEIQGVEMYSIHSTYVQFIYE